MKTILFLVGVEGTGHHLFLSACNYQERSQAHGLFLNAFNTLSTPEKIKSGREKLKRFLYHQSPNFRHIERASFPYNRPFNPLLRYDILEFQQILESVPELRYGFIILIRNIVDSTLSSWRRFDCNTESARLNSGEKIRSISIYEAAKAQESNTLYIQSQVKLIDESKRVILSYEDMILNPENIAPRVNYALGIDDFEVDASKASAPRPKESSPNRDFLENFFCPQRLSQFQFLNQNVTSLKDSSPLTRF